MAKIRIELNERVQVYRHPGTPGPDRGELVLDAPADATAAQEVAALAAKVVGDEVVRHILERAGG